MAAPSPVAAAFDPPRVERAGAVRGATGALSRGLGRGAGSLLKVAL